MTCGGQSEVVGHRKNGSLAAERVEQALGAHHKFEKKYAQQTHLQTCSRYKREVKIGPEEDSCMLTCRFEPRHLASVNNVWGHEGGNLVGEVLAKA